MIQRLTSYRRAIDALFLIILCGYILAGVRGVPFHGDESTTLWMSRDYHYLVIARDLDRLRYQEPPVSATEQHLRLVAAPLTKYIFGAAWDVAGFSVDDLNEQWDWGADWAYNQASGHAPQRDLLLAARYASALFLAGSVALLFVIGLSAGGRPVAYLASMYYALNPAVLLNGRRAMQEGVMLFCGLLVVYAGLRLLARKSWTSALLLGAASGLAVAAKHPNLITVGALFGVCAIYALWESARTDKIDDEEPTLPGQPPNDIYLLFTLLIFAGGVALAVFFALNPVLWDDPLARIGDVIRERSAILNTQIALFGGYSSPGDQIEGVLRQLLIVRPQYFEVAGWENFIGDQIAAYESRLWGGLSIGGTMIGGAIVLALAAIGLYALVWSQRWRPAEPRIIVGVWALAVIGVTALITPLEWQRYYLPAYPALGILAAWGIVHLWGLGRAVVRRRRARAYLSRKPAPPQMSDWA
jgi:hypothetical protein